MSPDLAKALRQVRAVTGRGIAIPFMGMVEEVVIQESRIDVYLDIFETTEGARDWTVTNHGMRVYTFLKQSEGVWSAARCLTIWDEEFSEVTVGKTYKRVTPESWRAAIDFARDCHRPGTPDQPLDSYQRVIEYSNTSSRTTQRMERHF